LCKICSNRCSSFDSTDKVVMEVECYYNRNFSLICSLLLHLVVAFDRSPNARSHSLQFPPSLTAETSVTGYAAPSIWNGLIPKICSNSSLVSSQFKRFIRTTVDKNITCKIVMLLSAHRHVMAMLWRCAESHINSFDACCIGGGMLLQTVLICESR